MPLISTPNNAQSTSMRGTWPRWREHWLTTVKIPVTGKQVMKSENVPELLAVMATAGLYDDSGKWLYRTGLPAKSGVGGGIIAVSPGKFGIAVISPRLDDAGNSVRAQLAIADISNALHGNPLEGGSNKFRMHLPADHRLPNAHGLVPLHYRSRRNSLAFYGRQRMQTETWLGLT